MLIAPLTFAGCFSDTNCVVSIQKTASTATQDTYTITYTDGSTQTLTVTNGRDGEDGQDLTIMSVYEAYVEQYGEISYADFLEVYLDVETCYDNREIIAQTVLSSAAVYTEFRTQTYDEYKQAYVKDLAYYSGSAVVYKIDSDYTYFITNYHVIYNENACEDNDGYLPYHTAIHLWGSEGIITLSATKDEDGYPYLEYDQYGLTATVVGGSVNLDLALLKVETEAVMEINSAVKAIEFAEEYYVGETAIAIGNSNGYGLTVTEGIVSKYHDLFGESNSSVMRIQTPIYPGNSGGGLFNSQGQLIGITNGGVPADEHINYAIPVQFVEAVAENVYFYEHSEIATAVYGITLGVTVQDKNSKYVYNSTTKTGKNISDITVNAVAEGSLIEELGIEVNDIIRKIIIDGEEYTLDQNYQLTYNLLKVRPNSTIQFVYDRGEETLTTQAATIEESDLVAR